MATVWRLAVLDRPRQVDEQRPRLREAGQRVVLQAVEQVAVLAEGDREADDDRDQGRHREHADERGVRRLVLEQQQGQHREREDRGRGERAPALGQAADRAARRTSAASRARSAPRRAATSSCSRPAGRRCRPATGGCRRRRRCRSGPSRQRRGRARGPGAIRSAPALPRRPRGSPGRTADSRPPPRSRWRTPSCSSITKSMTSAVPIAATHSEPIATSVQTSAVILPDAHAHQRDQPGEHERVAGRGSRRRRPRGSARSSSLARAPRSSRGRRSPRRAGRCRSAPRRRGPRGGATATPSTTSAAGQRHEVIGPLLDLEVELGRAEAEGRVRDVGEQGDADGGKSAPATYWPLLKRLCVPASACCHRCRPPKMGCNRT